MNFENDNLQNKPNTNDRRSRITTPTPYSGLGKLPPQATDLEEAVLGALMLEKDALSSVIDILNPEVFYRDNHQKIFSAIKQLFEKSSPVDILTVTAELRKLGELEMIGGAYYITELTSRVASAANIEFHARIIIQKYIQRELIRISTDVIQSAYEDTSDVLDLLDRAEKNLFEIAQNNLRRDARKMDDLVHEALKDIEALKDKKDGLTGVASGFTALDRMTSGWQNPILLL
jgi:replicative DNA helicase